MSSLRIATCQFSVEAEIEHNLKCVKRQINQAADQDARVIHFSECALSGYAGVEFESCDFLDWQKLVEATTEIQHLAQARGVWVLLGSTHQLSGKNKPHNSIYIINDKGRIVDRYDKRFCTGVGGSKPTFDLCHYSPGDHNVFFTVDGFKCSTLICYDYRFPELYRDLIRRGCQVLFQSFHNARSTVVEDEEYNIWKTIVPATMSCRAAENHIWVSANNSQTKPSRWGSFAVRPDGAIVGKLPLHQPGVLITDVYFDDSFYDAPGPWRKRAMNGTLNSGRAINDPRSKDTRCL